MKILLIEDDLDMQELIKDYLANYNFEVVCFAKPKEAIEHLKANLNSYEVAILDLMLPDIDGFDVCKKIREISNIAIIISSARVDLGDKILAFEFGADDYLSKPYEPRELVARIEAILRRTKKQNIKKISDFELDEDRILFDGYEIDFTKIEYEILKFMLLNANRVLSREQIAQSVKSIDFNSKDRVIDMHISNIRHKIGDSAKEPKYIKSIWSIGYKFLA